MDAAVADWIAWAVFWKDSSHTSSLVINSRTWPDVCRMLRDVGGEFLVQAAAKQCVQHPNTEGWASVFYGNRNAPRRVAGYIVQDNTASLCSGSPDAVVVAGGNVPAAEAVKAKLIARLFSPAVPRVLAECVIAGAQIPRRFVEWVTMSMRPPLVLVGKQALLMAKQYLPPGMSTTFRALYTPKHPPDGLLSTLGSKDPETREFTRRRLTLFRYIMVCDCTLAELADWTTRDQLLGMTRTLPGSDVILGVEQAPIEAVRKRGSDSGYWWVTEDDFQPGQLCILPPDGGEVISASGGGDAGVAAHARRLTAAPMGGYEQLQAAAHIRWLQGLAAVPLAHQACGVRG